MRARPDTQAETEAEFQRRNEALSASAVGVQFISGLTVPAMMFLSNVSYVMIAVIGGLRITSGSMSLGDVQAFL